MLIFQKFQAKINIFSPSCGIDIEIIADNDTDNFLLPGLLVASSVAVSFAVLYSFIRVTRDGDFNFLRNLSKMSLTLLYLQSIGYFLVFLLYGIWICEEYMFILTTTSILLFFAAFTYRRLLLDSVAILYMNHPNIHENSMRNPFKRFSLMVCALEILFGLLVFFTCTSIKFQYIVILLNIHPFFQILLSVRQKYKYSFRWYYQGIMWTSMIGFPVFIRGTSNNFLQLKPFYVTDYLLPLLIFPAVKIYFFNFQMGVLFLQKHMGARFFVPKFFYPNDHVYKVSIRKAGLDSENSKCSICLFDLAQDPMKIDFDDLEALDDDPESEKQSQKSNGGDSKKPFLGELKYCWVTPCNHFFHSGCLENWINQKPSCPLCRKDVPQPD